MNILEQFKWPAVALQSIFMALNITFLLHGSYNIYIITSATLIIFLFIIQTITNNHRFLYLFPVNGNIPTPAIDTIILKVTLCFSILLFYAGAFNSLIWALILLSAVILFIFIWKKYLESYNQSIIDKKINK